jgi:hypothetical protein
MTNEEKVLNYIKNFNSSPLYFYENVQIEFNKLKDSPLWECIERILELTEDYSSNRKIGERLVSETSANRTRSSFDIWRHILSIKPETTIFDVLREMYKNQSELVGHYCSSVYRQVFRLRKIVNNLRDEDWKLYTDNITEYSVHFKDWENIGL